MAVAPSNENLLENQHTKFETKTGMQRKKGEESQRQVAVHV